MSTEDAPLPAAPRIDGQPPHLLMVRAPYYRGVVDGLTDGATRIMREAGATFEQLDVAGAYELPQTIRIAMRGARRFDGFVALGCIVRGETDHYEFICNSAMSGLMQLAVDQAICLGTAVLTVDTLAQAVARSHETGSNKGSEAAIACLKQIAIARQFAA
jgi:6,7-dimethyl-8-ribityllumazine synthase